MLAFLCLIIFLRGIEATHTSDFYTAAVLEHVKFNDPFDISGSITRNLDVLETAARDAVSQGADIIVFPEAAIMPYRVIEYFFEEIPDPSSSLPTVPCFNISNDTNQDVLKRLSCIASHQGIYVIANVGEKERCFPENNTNCPANVQYYFYNTNVVFDSNGTLVARHRKRFLFFERRITRPEFPQYTVFNTSFGSFAIIVCFEAVFGEAVDVVERFGVENMIISSNWFDELPMGSAIHVFQGFALGNNVNVLAANLYHPPTGTTGSSIVSRTQGTLAYTFNEDLDKSKLLLARVPRTSEYKANISEAIAVTQLRRGYNHMDENFHDYTLTQLEEISASMEVCNNGLCCHLTYTSKSIPLNFYLGAFSGIREILSTYHLCQEVCILVLCKNGSRCTRFQTHSDMHFESISLSGNITTPHQYPSVLGTELTLVPYSKWEFTRGNITITSEVIIPLLSVSILGRCYDRDPPFPESVGTNFGNG